MKIWEKKRGLRHERDGINDRWIRLIDFKPQYVWKLNPSLTVAAVASIASW